MINTDVLKLVSAILNNLAKNVDQNLVLIATIYTDKKHSINNFILKTMQSTSYFFRLINNLNYAKIIVLIVHSFDKHVFDL